MTGRWIPRSKAARRLGISLAELDALVVAKVLHRELVGGDHDAVSEESVARYEAERAAKPTWTPAPRADDPEYWRERADYDPGTPHDEGDDL